MKVCEKCGDEIFTKDGDNKCNTCESNKKRVAAKLRRRQRDIAMESLGLTKVRGALGGTYWE